MIKRAWDRSGSSFGVAVSGTTCRACGAAQRLVLHLKEDGSACVAHYMELTMIRRRPIDHSIAADHDNL